MIAEFPEVISFKASTEEKTQIETAVSEGKFPNKSALIRTAIKNLLGEV